MSGCVTAPPVATPEQVNEQQRMLAESSQRIADALAKVAIVEQAASGVYAQAITPEFVPSDLQLRVAVNYQGDVKPLVYQLAQTVGYEVKTYGRSSLLT
ncbi:MAG: DotD/TraH family lipoprotein, partial [Candidatus Competibacteraceae bacterium]|nr:DotD/TraH family lipoprotein [Candidatus Competibacteraceae bacterium]